MGQVCSSSNTKQVYKQFYLQFVLTSNNESETHLQVYTCKCILTQNTLSTNIDAFWTDSPDGRMTRIALHAAPVNLQNATFLGGGGGGGGEESTVSVGQHELVQTPSVKQSVNKLVITSLHVWVLIIHAFLAISTTFAYWYTCPDDAFFHRTATHRLAIFFWHYTCNACQGPGASCATRGCACAYAHGIGARSLASFRIPRPFWRPGNEASSRPSPYEFTCAFSACA